MPADRKEQLPTCECHTFAIYRAENDRLRGLLAEIAEHCECDGAPDARTNEHGDFLGAHVCMYHRVVNDGGPT